MKSTARKGQTFSSESVNLRRDRFLELLWTIRGHDDIAEFRKGVSLVREVVSSDNGYTEDWIGNQATENCVSFRRDVLISELDQILDAQTRERAQYYLTRLERGLRQVKTGKVNDINLRRWKEYDEVITDSLWVVPERDSSGAHLGSYWGNFIPQIPHQLLLRYTKKGDWVLDPFLGSGTTLIECRRLGRNGIGLELNPDVARSAEGLIAEEQNKGSVITQVVSGDSRTIDVGRVLEAAGTKSAQLLVMHPPYHDIIKFSSDEGDLSNAKGTTEFLEMFSQVVDNLTQVLDRGRYFALVIGDKYSGGEWIPLGFQCMNEVLKRKYTLKSVIVKNFEETRAKRGQEQLWRYRAMVGGFYIFKHEYVFLFRKK